MNKKMIDQKIFDPIFSEKLKENGPVVKVHIECYHSSTSTSIGSGSSNLLTKYEHITIKCKKRVNFPFSHRNEKTITYSDQQEIPLTGWTDETEWPAIKDLADQVSIKC